MDFIITIIVVIVIGSFFATDKYVLWFFKKHWNVHGLLSEGTCLTSTEAGFASSQSWEEKKKKKDL